MSRRLALIVVVGLVLLSPSSAAAAVAPIVGTWESSGAIVRVSEKGGGFTGVVTEGTFGNCPGVGGNAPGAAIWKNIQGSGFSYTATIPWVYTNDCTPAGDGPTTINLRNINTGTLVSESPDGTTSASAFLSRVGEWPGAGGTPDTTRAQPCRKDGRPVLCTRQRTAVEKVEAQALAVKRLFKSLKKAKGDVDQMTKIEKQFGKEGKKADVLSDLWKRVKLPTTAPAAQGKFRNAQLLELWNFQEDLKRLANYKEVILAKADAYQASHKPSEPDTALDRLATLEYEGRKYDQLTPDQQLVVAKQAQQVTGALDTLILLMSEAGKSATRVTFAH